MTYCLYSALTSFRLIIMGVSLASILLLSGTAPAMPPHPDVQAKVERGEIPDPNFAAKRLSQAGPTPIDAPSAQRQTALTGPFKALCILVDFSDKTAQAAVRKFDTLIFVDRQGTVRDYYQEVSFGQVDLVTVDLPSSLGWQRAPQTYAYYVDGNYGVESPYPHNSQKLCEDLVDLMDSRIDFSSYDNDGNGFVDVVMIVHAGRGAEYTGSPNDMWSHKWSIMPRPCDGVSVSDYTVTPEYWGSPGDMTIGVFCHELGHAFGLVDLYDTDNSSYGTGYWSLMSSGSWNGGMGNSPAHPDAWSRTRLNWTTPVNITSNATAVSIPSVETSGLVYRLWTSGAAGREYFIVENRQKTGYDAALPASGLLIWHVDENNYHNDYEWYPGHTDYGHYMVALEQADNQYSLEKKVSYGDGGDPYPGNTVNTAFSPTSAPGSGGYGGSSSLVAITNISPSGPQMTADFAVSLASGNDGDDDPTPIPLIALEQNYPNPFNPTTCFRYTLPVAGHITITIFDILGRRVNRIISGYHQAGTFTAAWHGEDERGHPAPTGVYLYELATDEEKAVRKMLLLR